MRRSRVKLKPIAMLVISFFCSPLVSSALGQQTGPQAPAEDEIEDRFKATKAMIREDPKSASAYHELAQLYMSLGTPEARARAGRALTKAIRLEPDNLGFQLTQVRLLWEQEFTHSAERRCEKLLAEHPGSAEVAYLIGYLALRDYLACKDQLGYSQITSLRIEDLDSRTRKDFGLSRKNKAVSYLTRAIELDPHLTEAYHQLALLHYEADDCVGLVRIVESFLDLEEDEPDAMLILGLGYQCIGDEQKAHECYEIAIANMPSDDLALINRLASHAVDGEIRDLAYWKEQDPLFLTPYNERVMEHFGRVAYADLRFSRPEKNVAGWMTDMGKAYIRFGRWTRRENAHNTRTGKLMRDRQAWKYEDFDISFKGYDDIGKGWRFADVPTPGGVLRTDMYAHPPRFIDPYYRRKYLLPGQIARFKEAGPDRLEVAVAIPKEKVATEGPEEFVDLEIGLFAFDSSWAEAYSKTEDFFEIEPTGADSLHAEHFIIRQDILSSTYPSHLIVEVRDRTTGSIGVYKAGVTPIDSDTRLSMSDLLLAHQIQQLIPDPQGREELRITPNPTRTFHLTRPLQLYFELRNLQKDDYGRTRYTVSYRIGPPDSEQLDVGLFPDLSGEVVTFGSKLYEVVIPDSPQRVLPAIEGGGLSSPGELFVLSPDGRGHVLAILRPAGRMARHDKKHPTELEISSDSEGSKSDDMTFIEIDTRSLRPGLYELTVATEDVVSGEGVTRQEMILLTDPERGKQIAH